MRKVLVTGAAGALGRAVLARLNITGGFQIFSLVRNSVEGQRDNGIVCDLCDVEKLDGMLEAVRPDLILHLAAIFTRNLEHAYRENVEPSRRILDSVERIGAATRVLMIGSAAEYGIVHPEENPIAEDHALFPVSAYGVSKAWQTQLLGHYAARGVDVLCARIFNLFGQGISNSLFAGRLEHQIQDYLANRKSFVELGLLTATRDYLSLDEGARQILAIANYGVSGEIYHVGSGVPVTMAEFLQRQLALHGLDQSVVRVSKEFSNRHGYDVPVIYASMKKTNALGMQEAGNGTT